MSFTYKILEKFVKLIRIKKIFLLPEDKILNYARRQNQKPSFKVLDEEDLYSEDKTFLSQRLIILHSKNKKPGAILYLFGGGYITNPDKRDLSLAKKICRETGKDVWFYFYPLCIENSIVKTYASTVKVYEEMTKTYNEEDKEPLSLIGFSSGASLALGICLYINENKLDIRMPREIIASSPGGCLCEELDMDRVKKLNEKDIIVDYKYFETAKNIMTKGKAVPDYMLYPFRGNFKNFPMTYLYYGSSEVIYAFAPLFEKALKNYGVKYKIIVGEGLCHCYPLLSIFKEGREAQEEIIKILK
ncbi:MAG: alpha/beta hydrolase [Peptoniphilus grossensis]|uniref:alpha/beta hydrolase n=1 Tax=Peptoniphilus grossensis TaxID=1465756 RepID=UPI00290A17DC|nr:alpha/beta hydrolase [Peptoniphilus grossensis]MDU7151641.1 alpha/beta hydrolase [Peptoniphilus grossensis]